MSEASSSQVTPEHRKYCFNCGEQIPKIAAFCPKCRTQQTVETPATVKLRSLIHGRLTPEREVSVPDFLKEFSLEREKTRFAKEEQIMAAISFSDPRTTGYGTFDVWKNAVLTVTTKRIRYWAANRMHEFKLEDGESVTDELSELIAEFHSATQVPIGGYRVSGLRDIVVMFLLANTRMLFLGLGRDGSFRCIPIPFDTQEKITSKIGNIFGHGLFIFTNKKTIYVHDFDSSKPPRLLVMNLDDKVSVSLIPRTGMLSRLRSPYELVITKTDGKTETIKFGIKDEEMPFARLLQATLSAKYKAANSGGTT